MSYREEREREELAKEMQYRERCGKNWFVFWKASRHVGEEEDWDDPRVYHNITEENQGIAHFQSPEEIADFYANNSVSYGEEGGNFDIIFMFNGCLQDIGQSKYARMYRAEPHYIPGEYIFDKSGNVVKTIREPCYRVENQIHRMLDEYEADKKIDEYL